MSKISYSEYLEIARNPETSDETLLSYSKVELGEGGFDFTIKADPEKVELTTSDIQFENALQIGNNLERFRRQARFIRRKALGSNLPVLVSEGDSWFQFPLLVREIIDQLADQYLIWSVGAAGDTAENMVFGRPEYLRGLKRQKQEVRGFLFSAAGNDIIGEDPETQNPVLFDLLKTFNGDTDDIEGHVNLPLFEEKLESLRKAYTKVITDIRNTPDFANLPIFIHGYDYPFPYPAQDNDPRNPIHAKKNQWLGKPLDQRNIVDRQQRRQIMIFLINRLYDLLAEIAGDSQATGVWLVDCRKTMTNVEDWIDEIHGTSAGFAKITSRFMPILANAI